MEKNTDSGATRTSRMRRIGDFLVAPKSATTLAGLFCAILLLTPASRTAMTFLMPGGWQISGYYLDGLSNGLLLAVGAAWLLSIILLFGRKHFGRGLGRTIAIPVILFLGVFVAVMPMLFLPSMISGWPIDRVYSTSRCKHFILAYEPLPTDVTYRVFSAAGSYLNPIWRVELGGTILDYSEDGSLIEDPHLLLSGDEQLLVVGRGGHLTDAILIDSKQPLVQSVSFMDKDRELQWQRRTDTIRELLSAHCGPVASPMAGLSQSKVKARLDAWCSRMGQSLTQEVPGDWQISCGIDEVGPAVQGRRQVRFSVMCKKGNTQHDFMRRMSLVEDMGRLLIREQDTGLSWSGSEERVLCEQIRSALLEFAASGTFLDEP